MTTIKIKMYNDDNDEYVGDNSSYGQITIEDVPKTDNFP